MNTDTIGTSCLYEQEMYWLEQKAPSVPVADDACYKYSDIFGLADSRKPTTSTTCNCNGQDNIEHVEVVVV